MIIYDYMDISVAQISTKRRKKFQDNYLANITDGLDVILTPSYAGYRTGNRMMYLPTDFQKTVSYWTQPYPKPVQVHHDDGGDPIGRIIGAEYIDTSGPYMNNPNVRDFVDPMIPILTKLKLINEIWKLQQIDDYEGLGHFRAHAHITDKDAIQKILDGRYLTLSSSYDPGHVYCSICGKDLRVDDEIECNHIPGTVDKETGNICLIIPEDMHWKEVSYVNRPAIDLCKTIGFSKDEKDLRENQKSHPALTKKLENTEPLIVKNSSMICLYSDNKNIYSMHPDQTICEGTIKDFLNNWTGIQRQRKVIDKKDKSMENEILTETELHDYATMEKELDSLGFGDAKLSSEKRSKLKKSTFCGPERSFPVPDCPHVTAARRLIGRYKGPGDKGKILACVNRKAKALGCGGEGKDEIVVSKPMNPFLASMLDSETNYELLCDFIDEQHQLTLEDLAKLDDKVFLGSGRTYPAPDLIHLDACRQLLATFESEKESRGYKLIEENINIRADQLIAQKPVEVPKEPVKANDGLEQKVAELEIENGIYQKKIDTLEDEKKVSENDRKTLEATNIALMNEFRNALIAIAEKLQDENNKVNKDELKTKSTKDLKDIVDNLIQTKLAVKDNKTTDPVQDQFVAQNPTQVQPTTEDLKPDPEKIKDARAKYASIAHHYDEIRQIRGKAEAEKYRLKMIISNQLPDGTLFE